MGRAKDADGDLQALQPVTEGADADIQLLFCDFSSASDRNIGLSASHGLLLVTAKSPFFLSDLAQNKPVGLKKTAHYFIFPQSIARRLFRFATRMHFWSRIRAMNTANNRVQLLTIEAEQEGQRIDNYLKTQLKGVPKSLIYRILRKGEVRVNKKRIKPEYKLCTGDEVRVPPLRLAEENALPSAKLSSIQALERQILLEDEGLIVLNKPAGMAVHGGSGLSFGVIEGLRALRPEARFMELVHRLDRDTSGCLLIAKKRSVLKHLHEQLRLKTMRKQYLALVRGQWQPHVKVITAPLLKNVLQSGERIVRVNAEGKPSETRFRIMRSFADATLIEASPVTGRTHQIRVHTAHAGHPIACDDKYGETAFDQRMRDAGLQRLFLHASRLTFEHPVTGEQVSVEAPLDPHLQSLLDQLDRQA